MKTLLNALILLLLTASCQKEVMDPVPDPILTGITDTSIIFTKKLAYNYGQADTITWVYRKNMINGAKGYMVTATSKLDPQYAKITYFGYDYQGHLTTMDFKYPADPQSSQSRVTLTWDQNRISRIKWEDDPSNSQGMDRRYHYEMINDSLLIRYAFNYGQSLYLDSSTVNIFADKNFNKIYRIFKSVDFDFTTISGEKYAYYNERSYKYSGNDISSVSYYGETYFAFGSTSPHSYESYAAEFNFSRLQDVNPIFTDLEKDMFGKEYKMLCYDNANDTVSYFLSDYFDYSNGMYNDIPRFDLTTQDFPQTHSALGTTVGPLISATTDYHLRTEGGTAGQRTGFVFYNAVYTLDNLKRIKTIKRYIPGTNTLIGDFIFSYP